MGLPVGMRMFLVAFLASTTAQPSPSGECLCVFDIDRTLTGKQGAESSCPADAIQPFIWDAAYDGGILMLSELTQNLAGTFCHKCFLGIITAGTASGRWSAERTRLYNKLSAGGKLPTSKWNPINGCVNHGSPLVTACADGTKQTAVPGIQQWYKENNGAIIADSDVYFFDDRSSNVIPFKGFPYNARQISCDSRDHSHGDAIGLCGARLSEIKQEPGVILCNGKAAEGDVNLVEFEDGHYRNRTSVIV